MADDFDTAVAALDRTDESATARVFAARRHLESPAERLEDAMATHVRHRSRLRFEPPSAVARDLERLCRAAREQRIDVDPKAVLADAVPDSRETVVERARAIRRCGALGACERERRLSNLLAEASEAGIDVSRPVLVPDTEGRRMGVIDGAEQRDDPSADETTASETTTGVPTGPTADQNASRATVPESERLSSLLVAAGRNRIGSWPAE